MTMRLDRLLATLAVATRSGARELIRTGRVQLNGNISSDPAHKVQPGCPLKVDGVLLDTRTQRHLMMNKPAGLLTAASDSRHSTVFDLLPPLYKSCGCMPVGRLDKDTTGLLLFTTDGQIAHRLLAPKNRVPKVYEATVTGMLDSDDIARFAAGIALDDFMALPSDLTIVAANDLSSQAVVTVYEGKYHQVKRMFAALGHCVTALRRIQFGPIQLDPALSPGGYRELTDDEWHALTGTVAA
ncbi:MAG: pseudouridine synthase [Christensenellales bacterium]|jgi:16S rRNA pseudouridine516 synthase